MQIKNAAIFLGKCIHVVNKTNNEIRFDIYKKILDKI